MSAKLRPSRSAQVLLDRLIDWYEEYEGRCARPRVESIKVNITRRTALAFAKPDKRGGSLVYRGRQIETRELD